MDWKKYFCPICGIDFTDEDDVVVCPDCGTPHHRECWINKGHCANEALHGTEDSLECTYKKASCEDDVIPELVSDDKSGEYTSEAHTHTIFTHDFNQNEQNENGQQSPRPNFNINGKPGVLYEIALRKNQRYYIPRFIVMDQGVKGTGWNFMAFICPLAWCIYRKMYKLAAIILAVYMALMGASVYSVMQDKPLMEAFNECYEEDTQFLVKVAAYSNEESGATLTPKQQKFFELTEKFTIPAYIYWGTLIASYAMKFAAGIFVNKLYFAKLTKSIETAESKGLEGDALKIYLYKKNGVLPLIVALIIGFVEYSFM